MHVAPIVDYTGGLHLKGVPFLIFFGIVRYIEQEYRKVRQNRSRFSRAIGEWLKRPCFTPFAYFPTLTPYYKYHVRTGFHHNTLQGFAHTLSEKQMIEMWNWRAMYGRSVPEKTVRNMTTKDNLELFLCICIEPNYRLYNLKISLCAVK